MSLARDTAEALRGRVRGRVDIDVELGALTTFRTGGSADVLVDAECVEDLVEVAAATRGRLPVAVVGRGSNLLVSDDGFRGVVVRLGRSFRQHEAVGSGLVLGGCVYLPAAAKLTARLGLTGFEFAAEIPGTFGGAVRMNAGAHGRSMADCLEWVEVIDLVGGDLVRLDVSDLGYSYRHSTLPATAVVTRGQVLLEPGDGRVVGERIAGYLRWRREAQPGGRSAGSVFKNPPGDSAGRLIEAAGLKGSRAGKAVISEVHANFIVAEPGAKADDIWRLMTAAREVVNQKFEVQLEPEIRLLGAFPAGQGQD